jgi:hypothetical protein
MCSESSTIGWEEKTVIFSRQSRRMKGELENREKKREKEDR